MSASQAEDAGPTPVCGSTSTITLIALLTEIFTASDFKNKKNKKEKGIGTCLIKKILKKLMK